MLWFISNSATNNKYEGLSIIDLVSSDVRISSKVCCHAWFQIDTSRSIIGWSILDRNPISSIRRISRSSRVVFPSLVIQCDWSINMGGGDVLLGICVSETALTTVGPRHSFHHFGTVLSGSRWSLFRWVCSSGGFSGTFWLDVVPYTGPALSSRSSRRLCYDLVS